MGKLTAKSRQGGWFYTEDGLSRLKASGKKGQEAYEKMLFAQIGQRYRIRVGVTKQAATIIQSIKGLIPRALFVSNAIMHEVERRAKKGEK